MGEIIKADRIREAAFVLTNNTRQVYAALIRSNGQCVEVNAAQVDRILDEHDELLRLRKEVADYERLVGVYVDVGMESSVLVRLDEIEEVLTGPRPPVAVRMQSLVVLNKDDAVVPTLASYENLTARINAVKRQRAERG